MQSLDLLRNLPDVDRDIIETTLRDFLTCRARSDMKKYLSFLSPAIEITIVGDRSLHPYSGHYVGQDAVLQLIGRIDVEFEYLDSKIVDIVVDHDRAVVRRIKTMRQNGTGVVRNQHMCTWVRFQNNLIIEIVEYSDTALTAFLARP